jgi:hypothetical protein
VCSESYEQKDVLEMIEEDNWHESEQISALVVLEYH